MDVAMMRLILEENFGIHSYDELITAMKESPGLDIGLFTGPLGGESYERKTEEKVAS